jgi:hypothetical protein
LLSQSTWDAEKVNSRRLELLVSDPATAPHQRGVIAIDDSGDRKDGTRTAHVGRQWLGRYGKTDNGIVAVTTVWADERVYYPLHAEPYTPVLALPQEAGRSRLPNQAADRRRPGDQGPRRRRGVPDGGGRLFLGRSRPARRTTPRRMGFRHGSQTSPRHLAIRPA